jgi:hypothetical protein
MAEADDVISIDAEKKRRRKKDLPYDLRSYFVKPVKVPRAPKPPPVPKPEPDPLDPPKPDPLPKPSDYTGVPYKDKQLLNDDGTLSALTLPIQPMTKNSYEREMMQTKHLGYKNFLANRSVDDLKLALSRSGAPKATQFLEALCHPKNIDVDIAVLAERYHIGFGELMAVWRNDKLVDAMDNILSTVPQVARDTALDAESSQTCCSRCDGAGVMRVQKGDDIFEWVKCISCKGIGAVRKAGDSRSRQYVFEATGMIKSAAGINVNITTGAASTVASVLEELDHLTIPARAE